MTQETSNAHSFPPVHQRWAFLVGIDQYTDPRFNRLNFCVNDVIALEKLLTDLGYIVVAMYDQHPQEHRQPTELNVKAELEQICQQIGKDDLLFVHFACHGKLQTGHPILIMKDSRDALLKQLEKRLSVAQVEQMMRDSGASQLFLSLDACHTGVEMGRAADDPEFIRNVYELAEGFVVMAGSTAQQKAQEWGAVKHGVYTYYLLKALSGEADKDRKLFVSVDDIEKYVVHNLKIWGVQSGGLIQEPTIKKEGMGDMILADWRDRTPPTFSIPAPDRKTQSLNPSPRTVKQGDLSSEKFGVDFYAKLRDLLVAKNWKAADKETAICMIKVMDRLTEGWLRVNDFKNFPSLDLYNIDCLWVNYSQGRFGFSMQKNIWQSHGSPASNNKDWRDFGVMVGWKKKGLLGIGGKWRFSKQLIYKETAPRGHFPYAVTNLHWQVAEFNVSNYQRTGYLSTTPCNESLSLAVIEPGVFVAYQNDDPVPSNYCYAFFLPVLLSRRDL